MDVMYVIIKIGGSVDNINNITIFDGKKDVNYKVIDVFSTNNINYIIFTDDNDIYASRYNILDGKFVFDDIESPEEWKMIDERIGSILSHA